MKKLEAFYRRIFCETIDVYDKTLKIGDIYHTLPNGVQYIYVGKGKLWIKK